jgi:hypothetical protein
MGQSTNPKITMAGLDPATQLRRVRGAHKDDCKEVVQPGHGGI